MLDPNERQENNDDTQDLDTAESGSIQVALHGGSEIVNAKLVEVNELLWMERVESPDLPELPELLLDTTTETFVPSELGVERISPSLSPLLEQEPPPVVSSITDAAMELVTWRDVGKSARAFGVVTLLLLLSIRFNLIGLACLIHIGSTVYHGIQRRLLETATEGESNARSIDDDNRIAEDTCPNCLMPRLRQCAEDVVESEYWPRARDFVSNGLNLSRPINTAALVAASFVCTSVGQSINITLCLVIAYLVALLLPLGYMTCAAVMATKEAHDNKAIRCKDQKGE